MLTPSAAHEWVPPGVIVIGRRASWRAHDLAHSYARGLNAAKFLSDRSDTGRAAGVRSFAEARRLLRATQGRQGGEDADAQVSTRKLTHLDTARRLSGLATGDTPQPPDDRRSGRSWRGWRNGSSRWMRPMKQALRMSVAMEDQRAVSMVEGTIGALWRCRRRLAPRPGRRRAQTAMGGPRTCLADGNTMSLASACRFRSLSCAFARQTMARNASAPRCRYHWARPYDMWRGQGDARVAQDST